MPDTGAPWNIPYVDPTDLVRDYPQASEDLADAVAAGLSGASLIKQVVQTVKLDVFSTTSATFASVSGLAASITPTSDTSKILVVVDVKTGAENTPNVRVTGGNALDYRGAADALRARSASTGLSSGGAGDVGQRSVTSNSIVFLDSPATDSAITYQVEMNRGESGTAYVNRSHTDSNNTNFGRTASSITLIEVAA
jgi:hypothetical protein